MSFSFVKTLPFLEFFWLFSSAYFFIYDIISSKPSLAEKINERTPWISIFFVVVSSRKIYTNCAWERCSEFFNAIRIFNTICILFIVYATKQDRNKSHLCIHPTFELYFYIFLFNFPPILLSDIFEFEQKPAHKNYNNNNLTNQSDWKPADIKNS